MLDHLSIGVADLKRSLAFYDAVFTPLGYVRLWKKEDAAGYGNPGTEEQFAIKQEEGRTGLGSSPRSHLAITAQRPAMVLAFFEAAMKNGGTDLGKPGPRPRYGENYFAAFVGDPDGYKIEVVCHAADGGD